MWITGLDKKANGKDDARTRHINEPTTVVIMAPVKPISKKLWIPSPKPNIFSSSSPYTGVAIRATTNIHVATKICRPIKKACKFCPENVSWQFAWATGWSRRSSSDMFTTVNNAICIPSNMPTTPMRINKITIDAEGGTPSHIPVFPSNRAFTVTAKQKPRITSDINTRPQKNPFCRALRGDSLDSIGLPLIL